MTGIVTAEPGRLGAPALVPIQDATGGLVVRLPEGSPAPARGARLDVVGTLAAPYGQLEVRPKAGGVATSGTSALPAPRALGATSVGEDVESVLVTLDATVAARPRRASNGDVSFDVRRTDASLLRIVGDTTAHLDVSSLRAGDRIRLTGIVGQRASRRGALDGYRVWLRDARDLTRLSTAPSATPTASASGSGSTVAPDPVSIAVARTRTGTVAIRATVIAVPTLLDATGRRIVVEDASGGIEVLLPERDASWHVGERLTAVGTVGRAYGAPRLTAREVARSAGAPLAAARLDRALGTADEWTLVRVSGTITSIHRNGQRWQAELRVGSATIPVVGLAGAAIPATRVVEGSAATVVGIVRRPYPTATDRRFAVVPRSPADVAVTGVANTIASSPPAGSSAIVDRTEASVSAAGAGVLDVDLGELAAHVGERVRVGGLVVDLTSDAVLIDDGTAKASLRLTSDAARMLPLLELDDPINAVGVVADGASSPEVRVTDSADITRIGDLGTPDASREPDATAAPDTVAANRPGARLAAVTELPAPALVTLLLVATAATVLTLVLRKRRSARVAARLRRRLEEHVTARSTLAGPAGRA